MKKILCIAAILVLCGATASARTARTTCPPDSEVRQLAPLGAQVSLALDFCGFNTALFMGDETDGLLKGPRAVALIMMQSNDLAITSVGTKAKTAQLEATPASATEVVNPANAGKIDAAFFMSDESPSVMNLAVIHTPPPNHCGLMIITS